MLRVQFQLLFVGSVFTPTVTTHVDLALRARLVQSRETTRLSCKGHLRLGMPDPGLALQCLHPRLGMSVWVFGWVCGAMI